MAVPEYIRRVPRPVNTVVVDNGKDGPNRYAVRERAGAKYIRDRNPQSKNGKVIGHIFNGAAAFAKSVFSDILTDLLEVYPAKDACTVMAIATLRIIHPSITAERMRTHYQRTFVCWHYPGAALSANTICTFLQKLGQDGGRRRSFYQKRAAAIIASHHVAIDGTLKQDSSTVNDLSAFSYKARNKGRREVSVLYAYDIETMEPVCAEVFPGTALMPAHMLRSSVTTTFARELLSQTKGFRPASSKRNWMNAQTCTF